MTKSRISNLKSQTLGVGVAYALLIGLMSLPVSLHLSQRLLGNSTDSWIFYWNNWWLEKAIAERHNWFFTPYLFYPHGANMVAHSHSFLNSLLALPLKRLVEPVAAYNLVLLFGLWVSAIGMFLLVREITHHSSAALLAGFVFALTPYHLTRALAHGNLGSIHWWPFYALFLHRTLRRHRATNALYASLFAALTLWSSLHLALLLALWTVAYTGWHLLRWTGLSVERGRFYLCTVGIVGFIGIITLMLTAPVVLPIARDWRGMADLAAAFDDGLSKQTDLLAYLMPPPYHPLAGPRVISFYERSGTNWKYVPYLGYTALGLALVSLLSRRKAAWFWLLSTGFWMVLAAGPVLRLNGTLYPHIPMPYRFIGHLFPISAIRAPDRFNLLVAFSLAVSAGLGAAYLARQRRWLLVPLVFLVFAEYLCIPLPTWDIPPASPFFQQMAQEQALYGVVDYPMGYTFSKKWLYYQTLHGKPMVEGHIARYTPEDYVFIASNPLLRAFYQVAKKPVRLPRDMFSGAAIPVSALGPALRALETSGVRYILLHKPYLKDDSEAHFRRLLPLVPVYEDSAVAVYDVARPLPACYGGFPIPLAPDVALARFDVQHNEVGTEWQLQILAVLLAPRTSPLACQIRLVGEDESVLEVPITLFETLPEEEGNWAAGDLAMQEAMVSLPQALEPGAYHWAAICPGATAYIAPGTLEMHPDGHVTYLRRSLDIHYGDIIQLLGYQWRTEGTDLQMTILWKTLKDPRADYKVFVHLLNADGEIVRQHDAVPCNWQCPTSQWHAGDLVPDWAVISLRGLPPGEYHLAVGLYHLATQERLPARGSENGLYPNARFILPDALLISADCTETNAPLPHRESSNGRDIATQGKTNDYQLGGR